MRKKKIYTASPDVLYDSLNELWEVKIGTDDKKEMPLHYSAWGKTEAEAKEKATTLTKLLNRKIKLI